MRKSLTLITMLAFTLLAGCTDENTAQRALSGAGYTEIKFTGYSWFACGQDDLYATGFKAVGPTGRFTKGAVCSSLFTKFATVRTN
jgi:hypothetical protein